MNILAFRPGDLLVLTSRSLRGEERRAAQVSCVNWRGNGLVTYTPPDVNSDRYAAVFGPDVSLPTGSGAFDPSRHGKDGRRLDLAEKPYGFDVRVEKVGYVVPWGETRGPNLFRNPSYDLVNL